MNFTSQHEAANRRRYARRPEAAAYIRETWNIPCAESSLATLACRGGGPPFHKAGKTVLYALDDLDEWAKARMGRAIRSTSESRLPALEAADQRGT